MIALLEHGLVVKIDAIGDTHAACVVNQFHVKATRATSMMGRRLEESMALSLSFSGRLESHRPVPAGAR